MKLVRDKLYIGNIVDASMVLSTSDHQITHVLSVVASDVLSSYCKSFRSKELSRVYVEKVLNLDPFVPVAAVPNARAYIVELTGLDFKIVRMVVPWNDTETQNILDTLEPCIKFIEKGMQEGAVLVHCLAGVSRSAAAITAYLMQAEQKNLEDALASLRNASETACPNQSFLEQLNFFEKMGFTVDTSSFVYKKFHLNKLGEAYDNSEKIESSQFAADPASTNISSVLESHLSSLNIHQESEARTDLLYRCKKCRRIIASQTNVLPHSPGKGKASFRKKKKEEEPLWDERKQPECTSIFVEPMQWMTTVEEGAVMGKLSCVGCQARLGNFNWAGLQCSCGAWVRPAFQLHKSRLDAA